MKRLIACGFLGSVASLIGAASVCAQQTGASQTGQNPAGTPATSGTATGIPFTTLNANPWFANNAIQQHLNLTNQQSTQLRNVYNDQWAKYQQQLQAIPNNLTAQQRAQRLNILNQDFYNNFNSAANSVFRKPSQLQRFSQLYWQYRNYGAFEDPNIQQRLALNANQKSRLAQYQQAWHNQMDQIRRQYQTDPSAAGKQYAALQQSMMHNINSVLTPQQQTAWRQVIGEPYNFQATTYLPVSPSNTGTTK